MSNTPTLSWTYKIKAFKLVAEHLKREVNGMLRDGFKHMGVYNGEHVILNRVDGRVFCIDLICLKVVQA